MKKTKTLVSVGVYLFCKTLLFAESPSNKSSDFSDTKIESSSPLMMKIGVEKTEQAKKQSENEELRNRSRSEGVSEQSLELRKSDGRIALEEKVTSTGAPQLEAKPAYQWLPWRSNRVADSQVQEEPSWSSWYTWYQKINLPNEATKALRSGNERVADCYSKAAKALAQKDKRAICSYQKITELYIKAAKAYQAQSGALAKNDETAADLQEKIAEASESAAYNYTQAAEKMDKKAVDLYMKAGKRYEVQVEALIKNNEAIAEHEEKVAKICSDAAENYSQAADENGRKNQKVAELYIKAGKACEAEMEILVQNDKTITGLQKKMMSTLWSTRLCYQDAAKAEKEKNQKAAEHNVNAVKAYEARLEALAKNDEARAELQEKIASLWSSSAHYCQEIIEQKKEGNEKVAELYTKGQKACEAQIEALAQNDESGAEFQKKIEETLVGVVGAVSYYKYAKEEQRNGNQKAAGLYIQAGGAREAQVKAYEDHLAAEAKNAGYLVDTKIAENFMMAGYLYAKAADEKETEDQNEAIQEAKHYEAQAKLKAYKIQITDLINSYEIEDSEIYEKVLNARDNAFDDYTQALEKELRGYQEKAKLHIEATKAAEAEIKAYQAQDKAITQNDKVIAKFQEKITERFGLSRYDYNRAADDDGYHQEIAKECSERAKSYMKEARALQDHLQALGEGDHKVQELQKLIANALKKENEQAVDAYIKAAGAYSQKRQKIAKIYIKQGKACEKQLEALTREDEDKAQSEEQIAEAWYSAACYYCDAADQEEQQNNKIAEVYTKAGKASEAQAEALIQNDKDAAERQEKISAAWGHGAWDYAEAIKEESKGNKKAFELYTKAGKASEAQAEALIQNDKDAAERQENIAGILDQAANSYKEAANAELEGNQEEANSHQQAAQEKEAEVAILERIY